MMTSSQGSVGVEDFEDDLLTLHEDVMHEDDDGVEEILQDYREGGHHTGMLLRLITTEVHDTDDSTGQLTEEGMCVLHRAAATGSVSIFTALMDAATAGWRSEGGDNGERLSASELFNISRKCSGETPLHVAAGRSRVPLVNYLASNGADVDATDHHGKTALHHVATCTVDDQATTDILNILCVRGAQVNVQDRLHRTALHYAAEVGRYKTVLALLKRGADVSLLDAEGNTALHRAQVAQSPETTQLLIKYGAVVNQQNTAGDTPLMVAISDLVTIAKTPRKLTKQSSGYIRGVRLEQHDDAMDDVFELCVGKCSIDLLLEAGADVNMANTAGNTACHAVVRQGNLDLLNTIQNHKPDFSVRNKLGRTPVFEVRLVDMLEKLVDLKCSLSAVDHNKNTLLHVLCESNSISEDVVAKVISKQVVHIDARNTERRTALHVACRCGSAAKARVLCDAGADVDVIDTAGQNPLHCALYGQHDDVATELVSRGIAVNLPDVSGQTALHVAIRHGCHVQTIAVIADQAQDLSFRDKTGLLPATMAAMLNRYDVMKALLERSALIEDVTSQAGKCDINSNDSCTLNAESTDQNINCNNNLNSHTDNHSKSHDLLYCPLHLAVEHDDEEILQELIRQKLDVNRRNHQGMTPVHLAIRLKHEGCAYTLLTHKRVQIDTVSQDGVTPLHECVMQGVSTQLLKEVIRVMCESGLDGKSSSGDTALHISLKQDNLDFTRVLVRHGADLTVCDQSGDTPSHIAVKLYDEDSCRLYLMCLLTEESESDDDLQRDARITACLQTPDRNGKTVLHLVAERNYSTLLTSVVGALSSKSAINAVDSQEYTALHYACQNGSVACARALLQAGASTGVPNSSMAVTALAAGSGKVELISLLIEHSAFDDTSTPHTCTEQSEENNPLLVALNAGHNQVVEQLLLHGLPVLDVCTSDGKTALHLAAAYCSYSVVEHIIVCDIDVNIRDKCGRTALHYSIGNSDTDIVDVLLANGAEVDAADAEGNTALHFCAAREDAQYTHTDTLINAGANIDAKNSQSQTALHLTAAQPETDVLELLVANEAKVNEVDREGYTPLLVALQNHNFQGASILLDYGADVRIRDKSGQTALHKAVTARGVTAGVIRQLIRRGASMADRDRQGNTALELACDDVTVLLDQLSATGN